MSAPPPTGAFLQIGGALGVAVIGLPAAVSCLIALVALPSRDNGASRDGS